MSSSRIEEIARILAGAVIRIEAKNQAKQAKEGENRANSRDSEQIRVDFREEKSVNGSVRKQKEKKNDKVNQRGRYAHL